MNEPRREKRQRGRARPAHPDLVSADQDHVLGPAIDAYLHANGLSGARVLSELDAKWEEVVGAEVAKHCRPVVIQGSDLVIAVDHPAWATELSFLGPSIVSRSGEVLGPGMIESIKVHVRGGFDVD